MTTWQELNPQLHAVLIDAFNEAEFAKVLQYKCARQLDHLVAGNIPFPQKVYEVIGVAAREGWLDCLARGAQEANKGHGFLQSVTAALLKKIAAEGLGFYQSHGDPALSSSSSRLCFLQAIIAHADHYFSKELYTDLTANAAPTVSVLEGRSVAARRVLERCHRVFRDRQHGLKDDLRKSQSLDSFEALYQYVLDAKHVALIGDPGSGKTTTLLQLARALALAAVKDPLAPLPVFIPLSTVKHNNFDEIFAAQMAAYDLTLVVFLPNKIFLLLDGLNEMPGVAASALPHWLAQHPDVPVIVSCRKLVVQPTSFDGFYSAKKIRQNNIVALLDYFGFRLPLQRIDLAPLDVGRIAQFLRRYLADKDAETLFWRLAGERAAQAWAWWQKGWAWRDRPEDSQKDEDVFEEFWQGRIERANAWEIEKSYLKQVQDDLRREERLPGLLDVATNPFFLMAIVDIYSSNGDLHHNRGQLIAEFVDMLMAQSVEASPFVSLIARPVDVDHDALANIAYYMQLEQVGTMAEVGWVVSTLAAASPGLDVEALLRRCQRQLEMPISDN